MNAKRVVDTILRNNNFYSYTVTLNSKISRCNFNRQGNTEIQLESYERKEEELIVAAHEASHVLNYNENMGCFV
ncbi:hypothetical protein, partial [Mycobacterium tuberculosis]|uniref:hypothetical protein n=1 Tax=Mycobacterium tuberculosis TaxID=1773 RepID=UPI001BE0B708